MAKKRNQLAADTINGVYICGEHPDGVDIFRDMDFYDALRDLPDGQTVYGDVSDKIARKIESEYGIH